MLSMIRVATCIAGASLLGVVSIAAQPSERTQPQERGRPGQEGQAPAHGEMEQMARAGSPGEAHSRLDHLVGRFEAQMTVMFMAGAEPVRSTGVCRYEWVLKDPEARRGRFLRQEFRSEMMGMPFQGLGYWGYDNIKGEYTSVWMDSVSTSTMVTTGRYDEDDEAFTFEGAHTAPDGQEWQSRMVLRIKDESEHTFTFYRSTADVPEYKSLEIVYKRLRPGSTEEADRQRGRDGQRPTDPPPLPRR